MEFSVSPELDVRLTKLKSRDKKLASKIAKQLILFQSDHRHPSLRTHKLTGNLGTYWSISIDLHMRMLYIRMKTERISLILVRMMKCMENN